MTKAELENKHLSELHSLAAEAGVPKYRMLTRAELIEQLAEGNGPAAEAGNGDDAGAKGAQDTESAEREPRPRRRRRRERSAGPGDGGDREDEQRSRQQPREQQRQPRERQPREERAERQAYEEGQEREERRPRREEPAPAAPPAAASEAPRPRRRRRRRFGRRGKQDVTLQGMLLPPEAGRQAILCAETREGCTALLRNLAADLASASKGPDPIALLIDPGPEELADWKRYAPQAEIVSAGQPHHASDALAQAASRAGGGEDVILLVDSLTRLGQAYGDAEAAKEFFDAGRTQGATGGGSLTVVAALERA